MARNVVIPIRLTTEERECLREASKTFRVSLSEFVRRAALKRRMPVVGVGEVNRETYSQLCRIGNNLNQLMRSVNEGRVLAVDLKILSELRALVKEVGFQTLGVQDDSKTD